jgi:hypothetical protein
LTEETDPTSPAAAADSGLRRLVGVFVSPVETFASIAQRPTWILPVAIAAGLTLPLSELILSRMDWRATAEKQFASMDRKVTEQQLEAAVEQLRRFGWLGDVVALVGVAVLVFAIAAVLWGACQAFGWEVRFRQSLGITSHAFFPSVVGTVALLVALWNRPTIDPEAVGDVLHTNLGFLVDPKSDKVLHSLLGSLDLFVLWGLVLLVLGLAAAAKAPRRRVAALVLTLWALFALGKAGFAAVWP